MSEGSSFENSSSNYPDTSCPLQWTPANVMRFPFMQQLFPGAPLPPSPSYRYIQATLPNNIAMDSAVRTPMYPNVNSSAQAPLFSPHPPVYPPPYSVLMNSMSSSTAEVNAFPSDSVRQFDPLYPSISSNHNSSKEISVQKKASESSSTEDIPLLENPSAVLISSHRRESDADVLAQKSGSPSASLLDLPIEELMRIGGSHSSSSLSSSTDWKRCKRCCRFYKEDTVAKSQPEDSKLGSKKAQQNLEENDGVSGGSFSSSFSSDSSVSVPFARLSSLEAYEKDSKEKFNIALDDATMTTATTGARSRNMCRYHSGFYRGCFHSRLALGGFSAWSCCGDPEKNAPGCRSAPYHLECLQTSEALRRFEQELNMRQSPKELAHESISSSNHPSQESQNPPLKSAKKHKKKQKGSSKETQLIDLDFEESELSGQKDSNGWLDAEMDSLHLKPISQTQQKTIDHLNDAHSKLTSTSRAVKVTENDRLVTDTNGNVFVKYVVKSTDTIVGLGLRFGVKVDEIKALNRLTNESDIWTRRFLLLPFRVKAALEEPSKEEKAAQELRMRRLLLRRFMRASGCSSEPEALYYLEMSEFNYDSAIANYRDDIAWEESQPTSKEGKRSVNAKKISIKC